MKKGYVSIITPCFNGEEYVERFFITILNQTYSHIELIFVNDGSNDATEHIAMKYQKKFEEKGIKFRYIYQDNSGQAAALNQGLKVFQGEYLMWTDADDILLPDNVKHKVEFLEMNPQYAYVMCYGKTVNEGKINVYKDDFRRIPPTDQDNMFEDLIMERNVIFTPGVYMVRTEEFLKINPGRHIYESRVGQNFQMLLPMAFHYSCGYLKEYLFCYVIRNSSHSRDANTEDKMLEKYRAHKELLEVLLRDIDEEKMEHYQWLLDKKYLFMDMNIAIAFHDKELRNRAYHELSSRRMLDKKISIRYYADKFALVKILFELLQWLRKQYRKYIR